MNIDNFYSENSIDDWKLILGENLHYHAGSQSDEDIFEQAVKNLFCYIPKKSKILDCGCGWGGPAKLLINELECDVTGVTISKQQQKFIDQFVVYHADLDQYIPHEYYNIALFVESFCHLKQPEQVLHNFKNKVGKIIIKDYLWDFDWYNDIWGMYMRSKLSYINLLKSCEYEIISIKNDKTTDIKSTCKYWFDNFKLLDKNKITGQLKNLYNLCDSALAQDSSENSFIDTVVIVARPV
jgi:hypothetical protein